MVRLLCAVLVTIDSSFHPGAWPWVACCTGTHVDALRQASWLSAPVGWAYSSHRLIRALRITALGGLAVGVAAPTCCDGCGVPPWFWRVPSGMAPALSFFVWRHGIILFQWFGRGGHGARRQQDIDGGQGLCTGCPPPACRAWFGSVPAV
jgi:hypothetical protein